MTPKRFTYTIELLVSRTMDLSTITSVGVFMQKQFKNVVVVSMAAAIVLLAAMLGGARRRLTVRHVPGMENRI